MLSRQTAQKRSSTQTKTNRYFQTMQQSQPEAPVLGSGRVNDETITFLRRGTRNKEIHSGRRGISYFDRHVSQNNKERYSRHTKERINSKFIPMSALLQPDRKTRVRQYMEKLTSEPELLAIDNPPLPKPKLPEALLTSGKE
jgi:hypothetical protein